AQDTRTVDPAEAPPEQDALSPGPTGSAGPETGRGLRSEAEQQLRGARPEAGTAAGPASVVTARRRGHPAGRRLAGFPLQLVGAPPARNSGTDSPAPERGRAGP